MLDELRATLITLKCVRAGLNPWHGREVDLLPATDLHELEASRAQRSTIAALEESRLVLTQQFHDEIARHDPRRSARLRAPFAELTNTGIGTTPISRVSPN
jgi:hypothetical protein